MFIQIGKIFIIGCLTGFNLALAAKPPVKGGKVPANPPAATTEDTEKSAINGALMVILNQIVLARVTDFNIEFGSKSVKVDGVDKSVFNLKYLDIAGMIKFRDELNFQFIDEAKVDPQLKKVTPAVRFTTKDMLVIANAKIEKKGLMRVRFCQSYSLNNDFCNTLEDTKLLEINIKSPNFSIFDFRIKEINIEFDQQISDGKLTFKGSCIAWKSSADVANPEKAVMKPAECAFSGQYDSSKVNKFDYEVKLVSKKP